MIQEYLEAADKVSQLANEYSQDYELATILRAGSSKIMQIVQDKNLLMCKTAERKDKNVDENLDSV